MPVTEVERRSDRPLSVGKAMAARVPLLMLMALICGMGSTGCALPRAAHMYALGMETATMPPNGKREGFAVRPVLLWSGEPSFQTLMYSAAPAHEVLSFYREHFRRRGWIEEDPGQPPDAEHNARWYTFLRKRAIPVGENGLTLSKERLELVLDISPDPRRRRPNGTVKVDIQITGWYLCDEPSRWPTNALVSVFGEGAILFAYLLAPL